MIDLTQTKYKVVVLTRGGTTIELPGLRTSTLSENEGTLARQLQFDADNIIVNGKWLHSWCSLGSWMVGYADWGSGWQEVYRGKIFVSTPVMDPVPHFSITAYDPLIYLDKSQDDRYYYAGMTGGAIIRDILQTWNVPIGVIQGPVKKLGVQAFHGSTLAQMAFAVFRRCKLLGDTDYVLRWQNNQASVLAVGQNSPVYLLTSDDAVQSAQDEWSMENLVTRVRITGSSTSKGPVKTEAVVDGHTEYGILQQILNGASYRSLQGAAPTLADAKQVAQEMLTENGQPVLNRQLIAADLPFLQRGDAVNVVAGTISGRVIVSGIQHDWTNRTMTVQFNRFYPNAGRTV